MMPPGYDSSPNVAPDCMCMCPCVCVCVCTREVCDLDRFVQETALKEASAKVRLQRFIENLLERAERAERQLQELHTPSHTHTDVTSPDGSFTAAGGSLHGVGLKPLIKPNARFLFRHMNVIIL